MSCPARDKEGSGAPSKIILLHIVYIVLPLHIVYIVLSFHILYRVLSLHILYRVLSLHIVYRVLPFAHHMLFHTISSIFLLPARDCELAQSKLHTARYAHKGRNMHACIPVQELSEIHVRCWHKEAIYRWPSYRLLMIQSKKEKNDSVKRYARHAADSSTSAMERWELCEDAPIYFIFCKADACVVPRRARRHGPSKRCYARLGYITVTVSISTQA